MTWHEQYERTKRFRQRLDDQSQERVAYEDMLWAFFQNCWHLKDWVKNDPEVPATVRSGVEAAVKKLDALMVVADLANRSKHFALTRIRRDATVPGRVVFANVGGPNAGEWWDYRVVIAGQQERLALDLADTALREWDAYLRASGLAQ